MEGKDRRGEKIEVEKLGRLEGGMKGLRLMEAKGGLRPLEV
jgi:hypothetical protein